MCEHARLTYRLDQAPVLEQLRLVLDIIVGDPGLNLVAETLELLDLCLQIELQLFFLRLIGGGLHLVVYALEKLDAFCYLLQGPVDFGYTNSCHWPRNRSAEQMLTL